MASTNRRLSAALPLKSQFEQAVLAAVELALEAGAPTTHILNLPHDWTAPDGRPSPPSSTAATGLVELKRIIARARIREDSRASDGSATVGFPAALC
jgi:hypothetical protein